MGSGRHHTVHALAGLASQRSDTTGLVAGLGIFCCLQLSVPPAIVFALALLRKNVLLKLPDNAPVAAPFVLDSQLFIAIGSNICIVSRLHAVKGFLVAVYPFLTRKSGSAPR